MSWRPARSRRLSSKEGKCTSVLKWRINRNASTRPYWLSPMARFTWSNCSPPRSPLSLCISSTISTSCNPLTASALPKDNGTQFQQQSTTKNSSFPTENQTSPKNCRPTLNFTNGNCSARWVDGRLPSMLTNIWLSINYDPSYLSKALWKLRGADLKNAWVEVMIHWAFGCHLDPILVTQDLLQLIAI